MLRLTFPLVLGALMGGGLGYFNQCTTGTCPLTSSWWTGAIFGGLAGLTLALATAPAARSTRPKEPGRNARDRG
jgi:hypothetical protein